ncbi:sugar kinase [Vibrio comitans]|uniref:2-dehydro-3-deoxygluconokinase n=1 Tax=Vibrio comitans NBRC 102076 TaxID=1219078 RepID=A0A4Y3IP83_9VIBR|nr:sugar kinase [Vibrio comitans]GEA61176.1 2-dehydro-3-deoxygluconokinase [Vibrio comitans NBRC 102076]
MKRIAILGECMIELNGEPFGSMKQSYGGDSLNTAVYMARAAGHYLQVQYVSALGTDSVSQGMKIRWQDEGINTELVLTDNDRQPGLYLIQLDDKGERTFLYWRDQSPARFMLQHPNFSGVVKALNGVDMVYLSGISLAILPEQDRYLMIEFLKELKCQGTEIAFDSNYRPALWSNVDEAKHFYQLMYSITDLALVTNDDERALWGDRDETSTLNRLKDQGVKCLVLKMGADGSLFSDFSTREQLFVPATSVEQVVDTTSAGDSFNAGFISGWLAYLSPEACSRQGHLLAGTVIQHKGAIIPNSAMTHIKFNP